MHMVEKAPQDVPPYCAVFPLRIPPRKNSIIASRGCFEMNWTKKLAAMLALALLALAALLGLIPPILQQFRQLAEGMTPARSWATGAPTDRSASATTSG